MTSSVGLSKEVSGVGLSCSQMRISLQDQTKFQTKLSSLSDVVCGSTQAG